jgi:hypothetical protein
MSEQLEIKDCFPKTYADCIKICGKFTILDGDKYEVVEESCSHEIVKCWQCKKVQWKWLVGMRRFISS